MLRSLTCHVRTSQWKNTQLAPFWVFHFFWNTCLNKTCDVCFRPCNILHLKCWNLEYSRKLEASIWRWLCFLIYFACGQTHSPFWLCPPPPKRACIKLWSGGVKVWYTGNFGSVLGGVQEKKMPPSKFFGQKFQSPGPRWDFLGRWDSDGHCFGEKIGHLTISFKHHVDTIA